MLSRFLVPHLCSGVPGAASSGSGLAKFPALSNSLAAAGVTDVELSAINARLAEL